MEKASIANKQSTHPRSYLFNSTLILRHHESELASHNKYKTNYQPPAVSFQYNTQISLYKPTNSEKQELLFKNSIRHYNIRLNFDLE